jgi:protein-S-isoprenylcysteine O-methyltransferase Ste14
MTSRRLFSDPADVGARVLVGTLFLALSWSLCGDFARTGRFIDLLLLVGEGLVVVLTMLRRHATIVDRRPLVRFITVISMLSPFLLRPGPVLGGLLPESVNAAIGAIGLSIVVIGKLSLGYSFGLLPAHRGVVHGGAYRVVRHPIYLGYLLTHIPFLLSHPTLWNAVVLGFGDSSLIARAFYEERVLSSDTSYQRYQETVRWRLVPGLY